MCHEGQTLDFQSTALPTELPSLCKFAIPRANHGDRSLKQKTPNAQRSSPNAFASRHPTPNSEIAGQVDRSM